MAWPWTSWCTTRRSSPAIAAVPDAGEVGGVVQRQPLGERPVRRRGVVGRRAHEFAGGCAPTGTMCRLPISVRLAGARSAGVRSLRSLTSLPGAAPPPARCAGSPSPSGSLALARPACARCARSRVCRGLRPHRHDVPVPHLRPARWRSLGRRALAALAHEFAGGCAPTGTMCRCPISVRLAGARSAGVRSLRSLTSLPGAAPPPARCAGAPSPSGSLALARPACARCARSRVCRGLRPHRHDVPVPHLRPARWRSLGRRALAALAHDVMPWRPTRARACSISPM